MVIGKKNIAVNKKKKRKKKNKNTIDKIATAVRGSSLEQEVPTGNPRELEQQEIEAKQVARISFIEWGGVRGRP